MTDTVGGNSSVLPDSADHASTDSVHNRYPDIWTLNIWHEKKTTYPWLVCKAGKLGCSTCSALSNLSVYKSPGVVISPEWSGCNVNYNGSNRKAQLSSLRKKIKEHKESEAHKRSVLIMKKSERGTLEETVDNMNREEVSATEKVFRTAYYLAKSDRPFTDYFQLIELQELNGASFSHGLRSRYSATQIVNHLSSEMRQRICKQIRNIDGKLSFLIDESTTLSRESALIIYIKVETSKSDEPHFIFLDLLELPAQTAETVVETVLVTLKKHGFDDSFLSTNLVSVATDGASVMLGRKSGVTTLLKEKYPNIITWHCLNHRLELAVNDALKEVSGTNHFSIFMDKLYSLYSRSPKNQRELEKCSKDVEEVVKRIGRVFGTRWVASSYRAVSTVWDNYSSLSSHFEKAATDISRDAKERSMFRGLSNRMKSPAFLSSLALMYDSLFELSELSESLQNREMSVVKADICMHRTIRLLQRMKDHQGNKTLEAQIAEKEGSFRGIPLVDNKAVVPIHHNQFLTSLVNNMNERLFCMSASGVSFRDENNTKKEYRELLDQLSVLEKDRWPSLIETGYGENEVRQLCRRFGLVELDIINGFRDYIDCSGRFMPRSLQPLINCTKVVPVSTSECERGFSQMGNIITDRRTRLLLLNVSSLMFVKLHGPPLPELYVKPYVQSWLRKHRSAADTQTRTASTPKAEVTDLCWKYL